MHNHKTLFQFICVLSFLPGVSAIASDGVLEINHACAVNTGCFSGDTAGYPITIDGSAGRSYQLTSDLVIPDPELDGIFIFASSITITLNGFEIIGKACAALSEVSCRPDLANGSGVTVNPSSGDRAAGVSVANGSITGMGRDGVFLGSQAEAKNLRVRWNGLRGIAVDYESVVTGNSSVQNAGTGITSEGRSIIAGNISSFNGGDGIRTGIVSVIRDNILMANTANGVFAGDGSLVAGNTAATNGQNGITAEKFSSVQNNTVLSNQAKGLNLGTTSTYLGNTITNNVIDGVGSDGKNQGHNFCLGDNVISETCP